MPEILSLEEAQKKLGDVVICLEPKETLQQKIQAGKEKELWIFNPKTGRSGRGDEKFFDIRLVDRGGWNQLAIYQEPGIDFAADGSRIVGHVVVETKGDLIRVREANGLTRKIFELKPSSYSKDELCNEEGCQPHGISEADPQRIIGDILHFVLESDFPDEEGMTVEEFVRRSTDGRALNALVKVGLLVPAKER